ncbi:MAG: class I SAM-dependent methyltransferase [Flavobacteriales bacterium]
MRASLIIGCVLFQSWLPAQYVLRPGDPAGIGKWYMGREIAHTMCAAHAEWLDRPEREREERPLRMLERMRIAPTDHIADIGCGTGYHTLLMARQANAGKVYAVDIQAAMLDSVFVRSQRAGMNNVDVVLGITTDARLPLERLDKVLLVDVYHEFDHPVEMMGSIVRAMKPGALLFLVEFKLEDPWIPIKDVHRMSKDQCLREMAAAGLVWEHSWNGLPWQHFLVFRKPVS